MSLHDPNLALRYSDRLLLLDQDQRRAGPTGELGAVSTLSHLYRQPLAGPILAPDRPSRRPPQAPRKPP